jgi:phage gpG-like protein
MNKDIAKFKKRFEAFKKNVPRKAGVNAVNFFKDRFRAQNWLDKQADNWKARKQTTGRKSDRRAILTKTGRLRRSIRLTSAVFNKITVASLGVPYAQVHNEGFSGEVSQNVAAHTRKEHQRKGYTTRSGRKVKAATVPEHQVKPFMRKVKMDIPKRQFMGRSQTLNRETLDILNQEFNNVFDQ